ncbi:TRAP-type C4-dicarboxylate transport system, small permease component [Roseivivax halotolerans]|uniref:TRAP transporter small permease protein n=1 Tax=Roseivivax halotolerans TaxID=93684 RepID=A0A1I5Y8P7_9RHOB|nr:TRAP transporter small permease subunit [Roseivivax halotolerans]SFQ40543.1 TRAP-type C4-dicarboxylate transport system, small permease component [Roseivivax halotolerans]
MRRFLDRLYDAGLWLSAITFGLIAVLVALQIAGRLLDRAARALSLSPPGLTIPSLAEFGAFFFAAAVFLGLAGTLQAGGHVRVKLVTQALPERVARWLGVLVALAAAALAVFATWSSALQALDSYQFDSVSYGVIPIPLAIPQGVMTLGLALFAVALVDAAVTLARGGTPGHLAAEAATEEGN